MFLNEILNSVRRKQIEHLRNIKTKENFDIDNFLRENVFFYIISIIKIIIGFKLWIQSRYFR